MSWTIEIVSVPVPAEEEEAWNLLEGLRDQHAEREDGVPPGGQMMELYRRLTARYPCITEDSASPWADGPLINDFGDELTTLGIISSQMEEALPFVIDTATEMGFTVFDAADERIHRPKGWKPPLEGLLRKPKPARKWWQLW